MNLSEFQMAMTEAFSALQERVQEAFRIFEEQTRHNKAAFNGDPEAAPMESLRRTRDI